MPMSTPIDIRKILSFLPHRYPFLMVDRILELVPDQHVVGLKNVTFNEPHFQGHFPDQPIMPGVLVLEAMGQTGGILAHESMPEIQHGTLFYFMAMDRVRFRKPVVPGDQLIMEIRILKKRSRAIKMAGTARVEDAVAVEAELMASLGANT
jgi:beta-hydroxyacyl-ACP dehydratase FabZ